MDTITITRPDDWHLHLRDGARMASVAAHSAARFARAIVMPNLDPPVTTTAMAIAYADRIGAALAASGCAQRFEALMTLYLTEDMDPTEIARARASGRVHAVKLYPAGATTHSARGVKRLEAVHPVLAAMEEAGMPLLVHGEVVDSDVDVFDRERVFIERHLADVVERFSALPVVLEHVTTREGVEFVRGARPGVAGTLTAHHLLESRNALFAGGLRPHLYCLPVLKRETHRRALVDAATGGDGRFFLGTDSAPHPRAEKESACGCAGVYTAHAGIELYAEAFAAAGALERLEDFACRFGPAFYGLPVNPDSVTLRRESWSVPAAFDFGEGSLVPYRAGAHVHWMIEP